MRETRLLNLPPELDIETDLLRSGATFSLSLERRRHGKAVTLVAADPAPEVALHDLAHDLKRLLGTGGTVNGHVIELQGDQRRKAESALVSLGYVASRRDG